MHDPFPAAPVALSALTQRYIAAPLHLTTLPAHLHEILFAFLLYETTLRVSSFLSPRLFPSVYPSLPRRTQISWDQHVVSLVQSLTICSLAFWVLGTDDEIDRTVWSGRIFGYSGATAFVQAMAGGYFLWDTYISIRWFNILGPGSLAHGVSALTITILGFRPFANYYGLAFVLYELSTPFLNFHWFLDKLGQTGSLLQLVNGIILIFAFGGCRLVWGTYQSVLIYSDIWQAIQVRQSADRGEISTPKIKAQDTHAVLEAQSLPMTLAISYLIGNTVLLLLNTYWFWKMIQALLKRFQKAPRGADKKGQ